MNSIKVIKTEKEYKEALKLFEDVLDRDPDPDSEEGEQLSLLSILIQDYETRVFPEIFPDPIDAIKFRMEQAGYKQVDLIPYIGSKSRVSEILSGKRQLTLKMIRALEAGLGIPAKVLIRKSSLWAEMKEQGMKEYQITEEMCRLRIKENVCEGCGGGLKPIETVDNADNPTFWVGCHYCKCYRMGVKRMYFEIARELADKEIIVPYPHLKRDKDNSEGETNWLVSQTAGLSCVIGQIHRMLRKVGG